MKMQNYFKVIISRDEVTHPKPDPDIYIKCVKKLKLSNASCIAVEDSPIGVKAAKAAGLFCIVVTYTHSRDELKEADLILDSLGQVTSELIENIVS